MTKFLLFLFCLFAFKGTCYGQNYRDYYTKSIEAYKNADYENFLKHTIKANNLRPNHPLILYNLAGAHALNNNPENAISTLNYRSHFYASDDFEDDKDFVSLKYFREWDELLDKITELRKKTEKSTEAFQFQMKGFHPEGIVYDYQSSRFIIGDIRNGLIYIFNKYGQKQKLLIDLKSEGYWSAMGMAIDSNDTNILWVTSAYLPNFSEYTVGINGKSAVLKINITTGEIIDSYTKTGNHVFGDIAVTQNDEVYITDSAEPIIFKINRQNKELQEFARFDDLWNLQGLSLSDDESKLYLADYIMGIYVLELSKPNILSPLIDNNEWLRGGDGLYQRNNNLIILQNGTMPKRVAQIKLDNDGFGIMDSLLFTDQTIDNHFEPTLGTWVDNELYYIANSPWGIYNDNNVPDLKNWPILRIFKLTVD